MPKARRPKSSQLRPRFRVLCGPDIALGPGKAELLGQVDATGSISLAAAEMGMSYMRAWKLIKTMEHCFRQPLVHAVRGGSTGGGAGLTDSGREALALYRQMQQASLKASAPAWKKLQRLLRG